MDGMDTVALVLGGAIRAGTPLVLAALGELVTERSGVLNLGVEGMMLMGAVTGFIVTVITGEPMLGIVAAMAAGVGMSFIFAVLTLFLQANQVATGLALTIFGVGLSAFIGAAYVGTPISGMKRLSIPGLSDMPILGPVLFSHDPVVYFSIVLFAAVTGFLFRTRAGLKLRAIGEGPAEAHAIGHNVIATRLMATLFGGACAGLGGAYLSIIYTPQWVENMTAGRGWIALALVVFATWRPARVLAGAYIFGGITIVGLHIQATGIAVSSHLLAMLPYLATIVVLVLISRDATRIRLNAPASLGKPFHPAG